MAFGALTSDNQSAGDGKGRPQGATLVLVAGCDLADNKRGNQRLTAGAGGWGWGFCGAWRVCRDGSVWIEVLSVERGWRRLSSHCVTPSCHDGGVILCRVKL